MEQNKEISKQSGQIVRQEFVNNNRLPLIIKPEGNVSLTEWITLNKNTFEEELVRYGGILLRGFGINKVEDFDKFLQIFDNAPIPYTFRSSPRKEVNEHVNNIYFSTIYPNDRFINMHNESSYSRTWGKKIIFCCLQPAISGGETPIADSRVILKSINPKLVNKFRIKGVKYRRNISPDFGMSWEEVFQTTSMSEAQKICKDNNIEYQLKTDGSFIIEWKKPAIYTHPISKEETWFNHAYFFNKYARLEELGLSNTENLPDEFLVSNTFFGDGTEINYEEYSEIKKAYESNRVIFPYQKGDILFLDNMLVAHGRNPYIGERVIATAIIEAISDAE